MARRELKAISVMTRIEVSLHQILLDILQEEDDTASTFMRELLIREAERRGRLTPQDVHALIGAGSR